MVCTSLEWKCKADVTHSFKWAIAGSIFRWDDMSTRRINHPINSSTIAPFGSCFQLFTIVKTSQLYTKKTLHHVCWSCYSESRFDDTTSNNLHSTTSCLIFGSVKHFHDRCLCQVQQVDHVTIQGKNEYCLTSMLLQTLSDCFLKTVCALWEIAYFMN